MYSGVSSVFAACAAIGARRGTWRTQVANSWAAAPSRELRTPSSCLALHPARAFVTRTRACGTGNGFVLSAIAPDREEARGQPPGAPVERLLRCAEGLSPQRMRATLTEQRMDGVSASGAVTFRAVSRATRMSDLAAWGTAGTPSEMAGDTGMDPLFDGIRPHANGGAPSAVPYTDVPAPTGTVGQVPSAFPAGPTYDRPPSPPTATASLATTPPALIFSFRGNPHELQDRLRGTKALVFFYKASCGPCAAIRSKLLHAVAGAGVGGGGTTSTSPASTVLATEATEAGGSRHPLLSHLRQHQHAPERSTGVPASAPAAAYREGTETSAFGAAAMPPASPSTTMTVDDQKACAVASRFLEDAAKPFPQSVLLLTVDTTANAEVTALHDIRSLPTFMAYRNGCIVGRFEGSHVDEINKLVDLLTEDSPETSLSLDNGHQPQQRHRGASP
ncbi:hypothetical protein LSCM1_04460 [Leishmania martiniquensis]|uniref:Thioredoxin domain-containing protein n=1 Tax=Leishmania martiniquensis TaxID=1580590 RepID=A0A836GK77_9TRYP|nr:hypothetical protein LSCM1_04460 [Leishmania martiniquensis]